MKITFDPDFDGGAWPGPLAGRNAVAGESWLGPVGLLRQLESELGLGGHYLSAGERAAELVPRLTAMPGFWSNSTERDPLGSARELLRWRDALAMEGWLDADDTDQDRIVSLREVCEGLPGGIADRLREVRVSLPDLPSEIERLDLFVPKSHLPAQLHDVVELLERGSTQVRELALEAAPGTGDLGGTKSGDFAPVLDGSLQLLRADAPWMAAEEVAGWLAELPDLEGTVIIDPTPLLDREFRRAGLPTLGSREPRGGGALLEILPLVLMVGFGPADPQDVQALLTLAKSPVPRRMARQLVSALEDWPAVGSPAWSKQLAESLERIEDSGDRRKIADRINRLFAVDAQRAGGGEIAISRVRERAELVRECLAAFRPGALAQETSTHSCDQALDFVAGFERLLDRSGIDRFSEAELHRYLAQARSELANESVLSAEAGVSTVSAPGAMAGPARRVVWWNFFRETAPRPRRQPFTRAELAALAAVGVQLPDPAVEAQRLAARWRRPLDQATDSLLLVSPRTCEAGEERHPHPLWDEVCAGATEGPAFAPFVSGAPRIVDGATRTERQLTPVPAPQRHWHVAPRHIPERERLSHSAVEKLLSCPLQYTLDYGGRLRAGGVTRLRVDNRVLGSLGHALLADVMPAVGADEPKAVAGAEAWLDENGPLLAAELYLPGREPMRHRVVRTLRDAAGALARYLGANGLHVDQAEAELEAPGLGGALAGRVDLLLGPRPAVLDAKWGGYNYQRAKLENGTASQLAFYAKLLGGQRGRAAVSVGYFILTEQQVVTVDADIAAQAVAVEGESWAVTWVGLERAFDQRRQEFREGALEAPGNPDEEGNAGPARSSVDGGGRLVLSPGCRFCDYKGLCGLAFQQSVS